MSKKKVIIVESCAECDYFGKCLYKIRTEELHTCKRDGTTHPDCPLPDYPEDNRELDAEDLVSREEVVVLIEEYIEPCREGRDSLIDSVRIMPSFADTAKRNSVADKNKEIES